MKCICSSKACNHGLNLRFLFILGLISCFSILNVNAVEQDVTPILEDTEPDQIDEDEPIYLGNEVYGSWTVKDVPNPKHESNTWVSNPNGILSISTVAEINEILQALEDSLSVEVAVVVLNSIGEDEPRDFAHRLFNKWGVGKRKDNNGLLILLTVDVRDITFETGYALEGVLPDAICKRIQMNEMVPYLKDNNWDEGMISGVEAVVQTIYTGDYVAPEDMGWWEKILIVASSSYCIIPGLILLILNYYVWKRVTNKLRLKKFTPIAARNYINRFSSVSMSTLAYGIFLVPFWPALLAIIIWLRIWNMPRIKKLACTCPNCKAKNLMLIVKKDRIDKMNVLTDSDRAELKLKTVKINVYKCDDCGKVVKDRIPLETSCRPCPNCHHYTLSPTSKSIVVDAATIASEGSKERKYECVYCGAKYAIITVIPKIEISTSSSSSFGGGGSSSGDGGGGSFGGGSSGGGGASSRF